MIFAKEPFSFALAEEILPLSEAHFGEVDAMADKLQTLGVGFYMRAYQLIRVFTAREAGVLMGYAVFFVQPHPHYENSLQAQQDLLYLCPAARRGFSGYRFMKFCDSELEKEGVEVILQHSPLKRDIGKLLKRLGYEPIQTLFMRRVVA